MFKIYFGNVNLPTMSDEEDEYEYEYDEDDDDGNNNDGMDEDNNDDNEDNQFEYTDEEEDHDDAEVALENAYYNAKGLREVDLNQAAIAFENVIQQEQIELAKSSSNVQYGPWSFKAIKHLVKLHLRAASSQSFSKSSLPSSSGGGNDTTDKTTGSPEMILHHYNRLLECVSVGEVSPAAVEKGISGMLERVARSYGTNNNSVVANSRALIKMNTTSTESIESMDDDDMKGLNPQSLALAVYDSTLTVFHPLNGPCKNERLWFKTNLKYGQLLYEMNETTKLQHVIKDLLQIHNQSNDKQQGNGTMNSTIVGVTGSTNSTNSMEIYALQIQLYSRQKDHKKLRATYQRAINVMGGIPHPRTLALIHELGGKMHMSSREYELAGKTFFQAFKSYDEAGDISRLRCLKYLVLASMLHASTINPFDSQEARPYRDDPEIVTMTELVSAFHNNEIQKFESILKKNSKQLLGDEFIREHIEDLLRTIRTQVLRRVIRPYTRIALNDIAIELNDIPITDVEHLLVHLILDGTLDGKIDRVNNVLIKQPEIGSSGGKTVDLGAAMNNDTLLSSPNNDFAVDTSISSFAYKKSDTIIQCEVMDTMIGLLEDLSNQTTNISYMKGKSLSTSGSGMRMTAF
jgi:COP9 signalosome complex subunit 2